MSYNAQTCSSMSTSLTAASDFRCLRHLCLTFTWVKDLSQADTPQLGPMGRDQEVVVVGFSVCSSICMHDFRQEVHHLLLRLSHLVRIISGAAGSWLRSTEWLLFKHNLSVIELELI